MNCPHSRPAPHSLPPLFLPLKQAHPPPAPLKVSRSHSVRLSMYLIGDLSLSLPASPSKAGACVRPWPVPWGLVHPACPPRTLLPLGCVSSPRWPPDCSSLPGIHPARPVPLLPELWFLGSTRSPCSPHSTHYYHVLFVYLAILFPLKRKSRETRTLFCSPRCPQNPGQGLERGRCLVFICWMNSSVR